MATDQDEDKPEVATDRKEEEDHTKLLLAELEKFAKVVQAEEVFKNKPASLQFNGDFVTH